MIDPRQTQRRQTGRRLGAMAIPAMAACAALLLACSRPAGGPLPAEAGGSVTPAGPAPSAAPHHEVMAHGPEPEAPPAPSPTAPADNGPSGDAASAPRPDGAPCSRGAECASGVCEGEGCGPDEARCAPAHRPCTRDLRPYCGCDGATFRASGRCPGRPFRHRGDCP